MDLIVVLNNIRSCYNVGAILRTVEGFGLKKVILSGYTPRIDDDRVLPHLREKLNREIHKTALGAEEMLELEVSDDIIKTLGTYKADGWQIVGLENNIKDGRLVKLGSSKCKSNLSEKIVLILGEEVTGIDKSLYELIDVFIEIPMKGRKESFNVSVAAGIALFGILERN